MGALRNFVSREIKWTEELENHLDKGTELKFSKAFLKVGADRPFIILATYFARVITHRVYQQDLIFPIGEEWNNTAIGFSGVASSKPFQTLAANTVPSFDLLEKTQFVPRYRYECGKTRLDNITDWALEQFKSHYEREATLLPQGEKRARITKDAIFHYVYGVLHDPIYREKYAQNLKREFPRIPFLSRFLALGRLGRGADGTSHRLRERRALAARAHRYKRRESRHGWARAKTHFEGR